MVFYFKLRHKPIVILLFLQFLISIITVEVVTDERLPANIRMSTLVETTIDFCSVGYLLLGERILFVKLFVNDA